MTGTLLGPSQAWAEMESGNERFVAGTPRHPSQDVAHRAELAGGQAPIAALLGCSDSRLAAEIIFDKGLGDLFVIRNAGQVVSASVTASLEYAVALLNVPLIVVLAHDACGAIQAAIDLETGESGPIPPRIAVHIAPIRPAVRGAHSHNPEDVGRHHLERTVAALLEESDILAEAVAAGTLAVVGANYRLAEGRVDPVVVVGSIEAD